MLYRSYYLLKPVIPRFVQILLRRRIASYKRKRFADVWPIDVRAGHKPKDWMGWPDGKKFGFVLTHDVETASGQDKCYALAELETRLGFRSSFNFVAEGYLPDAELRRYLIENGFEIGMHGLVHNGNLFRSREYFLERVPQINRYLREWGAVGFRTPSMFHNLEWICDLNVVYDCSTFDTDPFEPQPDGTITIFPFRVSDGNRSRSYVELPYTLPQDHTLFIVLEERDIDIWRRKLDWIADKGGMALLNTHPDYMNFDGTGSRSGKYPVSYYRKLLEYVEKEHKDEFWHGLPLDVAENYGKGISLNNIE